MTENLRLLRKDQPDETVVFGGDADPTVLLTPSITEDYWTYCVPLDEGQAVVGFPKFGTIGIGFAVEDDWNTNLPYECETDQILLHIWHNRAHVGDSRAVRTAIAMIQIAAHRDRGSKPGDSSRDWAVSDYWPTDEREGADT